MGSSSLSSDYCGELQKKDMQEINKRTNVKRELSSKGDKEPVKIERRSSGEHDVHSHKVEEKLGHDFPREDAEEHVEESKSQHVTYGFHLVEGKMCHRMEDFIVAENRRVDDNELGLSAIFDGHSSRDVVEYIQAHLFDYILEQPDFWTNPKKAVKRAYKTTNDEILEKVVDFRGGGILINKEKLIIANVGDSRAVLCRNTGKAKQLTVDHEPEKEKELVESRGGFETNKSGSNVPRVDGQLSMTRIFGDAKVGEHITSEPDIRIERIDEDTKFIILASDGLWKVMSNKDAFECIRELNDAQEALEEFIKEALARKSYDDIYILRGCYVPLNIMSFC